MKPHLTKINGEWHAVYSIFKDSLRFNISLSKAYPNGCNSVFERCDANELMKKWGFRDETIHSNSKLARLMS